MNGMAGTGKTTILYSLCKWLEENEQLSGNFFCSRSGSERDRDAKNIIPTIAYQMAQYSSPIRSALSRALEEDSDASTTDIDTQFEMLIQQPMQEVVAAIPGGVVVVIDALDECSDSSTAQLLLQTLLERAATLPMKFCVASRPVPSIRQMLLTGYSPSVVHMYDIEAAVVTADIKKYLIGSLGSIIPSPDLELLTKCAGRLFIYAATAVRYIYPADIDVDSSARLQAVLAAGTQSTQHAQIDSIYNVVLSAALDHTQRDQKDIQNTRLVLWTVVCAKELISMQTLELLLDLTEEDVRNSLEPLQSILHVPKQDGTSLISVFHASFLGFIFDYGRSRELYCDRVKHNQVISDACLALIRKDLEFKICKPGSSYVLDENVSVGGGGKAYTTAIGYALRYWGEHFRQGCAGDQDLSNYLGRQLGFSSCTVP